MSEPHADGEASATAAASPDALIRSTEELASAFAGLDARSLLSRPAPGEWSAWDIAYHVAQIEVWYYAKACEAASPNGVTALTRFLEGWGALRSRSLALASAIDPARLDEPGLLSGVPEWTPRLLLDQIAAHDDEHAAQVWQARGPGDGVQIERAPER